jgi:hypothetical protein
VGEARKALGARPSELAKLLSALQASCKLPANLQTIWEDSLTPNRERGPLSACRSAWRICSGVNLLFRISGLLSPESLASIYNSVKTVPPGLRFRDPGPQW